MTMTFIKYTEVSGCAIASDGGSLAVQLTGAEGEAGFTLERSIASRGTSLFGKVSSNDGQSLTADETHQLCHRLRELQDSMPPCSELVEEFIHVAELHAV